MENELSAGTLDLAVDVRLPVGDEIWRHKLWQERLVVLPRQGHPSVGPRLDLETYLAQEHILVTQRRWGLSAEDYELNRQNLRRNIRMRCQSYMTACRTVPKTDMILTIALRWAPITNAHFGNRLTPFPMTLSILASEVDAANLWLREL